MNIRKPTDYVTMFTTLDKLMAAQLPQMELYCEIGRVVSGRAEKGAAVAASEYLQTTYPAVEGFSPRNLRRMRAFYATYEESLKSTAGDEPRLDAECGDFRAVQQQRGTGVVHPSCAALRLEESKTAGSHRISGMAAFFSRRASGFLLYWWKRSNAGERMQ